MIERIKHNLTRKLLGEAGSRLVGLAFNLVLANGLGTGDYGRYSYAWAFAGVLSMCGELGLNTLVTQKLAHARGTDPTGIQRPGPSDSDGAPALLARFAPLRWASVALVVAATVLLAATGQRDRLAEITAMALFMAGNVLLDYHTAVLTAFERMTEEALLRVGTRILVAGGGITAVLVGAPVVWVVGVTAVANLVAVLAGSVVRKRLQLSALPSVDLRFWGRTLAEAVPVAFAWFGIVLYFYMDNLVLEALGFQNAELGQYGAASKILEAAQAIPLVIVGGTFAVVAQLAHDRKQAAPFFAYVSRLALLSLPGVALAALVSPSVARLLYGASFVATGPALAVLALAAPFFFSNLVAVYYLLALGQRWTAALARGASCVVKLALIVGLAGRFGVLAAALATLLADLALFAGLLAWRTRQQLAIPREWRLVARVAVVAAAGIAARYATADLHLALAILTVVAAMLLAMFALGLLRREELVASRPSPQP